MAAYNTIPQMNWMESDLAEQLTLFKQTMNLYLADEEIVDNEKKSLKIQRGVGIEGLKRLNASGLSEVEIKNPENIWKFFEDQLNTDVNFRVHRLHLMRYRQTASENLDDFITRARKLAKKCQFSEDELNERLMELVIASTPHDGFCKDLLTKPVGYKISELLVDGRKFEAISAGKQQLKEMSEHNVSAIRVDCSRCGLKHAPRSCPAYHNTCEKCGKTGHLGKLCRSSSSLSSGKTSGYKNNNSNKNSQHNSPQNAPVKQKNNNRRRRKKFHAVSDNVSVSEDEYVLQYDAITVSDKCFDAIHQQRNEAFTNLRIDLPGVHDGKHSLKLKIDTGASGNTLPIRTLRQMYPQKIPKLQPNNVTLTAYNGENIKCSGKFTLNVYHEKKKHPVLFYVVDVTGPAVIGLPTCEQLNIVTINVDQISPSVPTIGSIDDLTHQYPKQFDTIGNFKGTAKLKLKDDAIPFIDAPRKCPIHIKDELKAELDKMERQEVIRKVDEHTDWVSSLAYTTKRDGSLRICLDPQKLNNALRRCPHKIPTLEELNPMFTNAKIFTKLDAKAGYWAVKLDESSQLLTTFRTPFGRYCWRRLPFGLNNSQDIFQARMDSILEGLKGVVSIADDVCVFGATEKEHDVNLINLMERAKREGLVFNSTKCHIKKSEISFFGNTYTKDGIKPDINKIRDLKDMPKPQSKEELMRFLGVITYLSQFIPGLADRAHSLRGLLKKTSDFIWETDHQQEFEQLKNSVTSETCLQYYDRSAPVTLEVDASQKGLGAALLQNEKPVAFGSKTLTDCQSRYSNIEREMLALVFGIQRYHTYLYARPFVIITDHQPLVNITAKPIHSAPPRLQRMLMQIQGYNFTVRYRPGKQMILADALSRSPNAENNSPIQLDLRVDGLDMQLEDHTFKTIALINFSESKQKQLQTETSNDPFLNVRATPLDANMPSPAELMFGRAITKLIPHRSEPGPVAQRDWLHNKQQQMKSYYDKSARKTDLAPMYVGQEVRILDKVSKTWCPGTITRKCAEPRSYMVQTPNGNELRRNRSHLREMSANATPRRLQFADNNTPAAQHTAPSSYHETQTLHPPNTPACSPNEHIEKPTVQNPELPRASPPQVPLCSGQYRTRSGRVSKPTPRYNSEN